MAKYATNGSGDMLLPSSIQATESISGSVVPLAMFIDTFRYQKCLESSANLLKVDKSHQNFFWKEKNPAKMFADRGNQIM